MGVESSAVDAAASAAGRVLRGATALVALRPAAKPLHPRGAVLEGSLRRHGSDARSGVAWLDDHGQDNVVVRTSRAVGLPAPIPDVFGLALRAPTSDGGFGDLLFATTGLGRLTRFTLTPARSLEGRPLTTLLPYRTPSGPVVLSARSTTDGTWVLAWAVGRGGWHRFAELVLRETTSSGNTHLSFDPVQHVLPGLDPYPWVRRLREPSYAAARRSRRP